MSGDVPGSGAPSPSRYSRPNNAAYPHNDDPMDLIEYSRIHQRNAREAAAHERRFSNNPEYLPLTTSLPYHPVPEGAAASSMSQDARAQAAQRFFATNFHASISGFDGQDETIMPVTAQYPTHPYYPPQTGPYGASSYLPTGYVQQQNFAQQMPSLAPISHVQLGQFRGTSNNQRPRFNPHALPFTPTDPAPLMPMMPQYNPNYTYTPLSFQTLWPGNNSPPQTMQSQGDGHDQSYVQNQGYGQDQNYGQNPAIGQTQAFGQGQVVDHTQANAHYRPLVQTPLGPLRVPNGEAGNYIEMTDTSIGIRISHGRNNYGRLVCNRPPVNTSVPGDIKIGMMEICTFFPNWLMIPNVAVRAIRNGWGRKSLAKAQLNAIDQLTKSNLLTCENRIQKQISDGGKLYLRQDRKALWDSEKLRELGVDNNLTAVHWRFRREYDQSIRGPNWGHIELKDIYSHVPHERWPRGPDRLLLTQCFEYAREHPNANFDTSHIQWMVENLRFAAPNALDANHDMEALDRFEEDVANPLT